MLGAIDKPNRRERTMLVAVWATVVVYTLATIVVWLREGGWDGWQDFWAWIGVSIILPLATTLVVATIFHDCGYYTGSVIWLAARIFSWLVWAVVIGMCGVEVIMMTIRRRHIHHQRKPRANPPT